jgi:hypothetical protein
MRVIQEGCMNGPNELGLGSMATFPKEETN